MRREVPRAEDRLLSGVILVRQPISRLGFKQRDFSQNVYAGFGKEATGEQELTPAVSPGYKPGVQTETVPNPPHPRAAGGLRVLHTADWHLGKTLCDHERTQEHSQFLDFLLRTIEEQRVDVLVVSGDVFDSANPPQSAETLYFNFLSRLHALGHCAAVITAGNHDSPTHLESPRRLLRALNVRIAGVPSDDPAEALIVLPSPENPCLVIAAVPFLRDRDLRTGVLGQSQDEIQRDLHTGLRSRYTRLAEAAECWRERGVPVLATGHLTMLEGLPSDSERSIHIGGLGAIGADLFADIFCYGALGHLHRPQPVGGQARLRYSGSPIALSFSEAADHKEVRLLEFRDGLLVENCGIGVSAPRRLARLRVARAELESSLLAFAAATDAECAGMMPPWLEVVVENAQTGENLYEVAQAVMKDHPCRVLRVTAEPAGGGGVGLSLESDEAEEEADDLLADPGGVFGRRLDQLEDLEPGDRAALETAFTELHGMLLENEREEELRGAGV